MKKKIIALLAIIATTFAVSACGDPSPSAPTAGSDSQQKYAEAQVPVDTGIYVITGEVSGQINSVTRQVEPAKGSVGGYMSGGFGTMSGTFFGPVESGKGFVRLKVGVSNVDLAPVGELVLLKVTDTKATALQPGDVVTFKCRKQYENVAAVQDNERLDSTKAGTWELDYCRLASPKVDVR